MWIQELNIKNFGKFYDRQIVLKPGINLIYGENESGKSTLHAFIRGCFYGIKKMRGRASKTDVYNRYQPWEHGSFFAGSMRFVCGGKLFRLERDFTKGVQVGVLVCETDGERLSLENGDLEMLLGNVGEMTFDNTVSIGQLRSETDEGLAIELKNHMANYEGTGNASIRVEKAIGILKEKKKLLQKEILEEKKQEEEKRNKILAKLTFLKEEMEKEKGELEKVKVQYKEAPVLDNSQQEPKRGFFYHIILIIKTFFARLFGKEPKTKETIVFDSNRKQKLEGKIEHLEGQIQEKSILIENGLQELQLMEELFEEEKIKLLTKEAAGCDLAMKRIQEVVSQMQLDVGQILKKRTSEIFRELTDGRYEFVELKEDLTMLIHGKDHVISVEQLSRGTIWQLYFALRMAANEILCQEEDLPVILDDAFAMYDDHRLEKLLEWLARQEKQILILTCQKREGEILRRKGVMFHEVKLTR